MADHPRFESFLRAMSSIVDNKCHSMRLKRRESEQLFEERGVWGRESQEAHAAVEGECPVDAVVAMKELVEEKCWLPSTHRVASKESYRQYLLFVDPLERFSVVSFVWSPGQSTPIHDHGTWGVIGQLEGSECEKHYRWKIHEASDGVCEFVQDGDAVSCHEGSVTPVDIDDVHLVTNEGDTVAISIHAYGSDIGTQKRYIYENRTGRKTPFVSGYSPGANPLLLSLPLMTMGEKKEILASIEAERRSAAQDVIYIDADHLWFKIKSVTRNNVKKGEGRRSGRTGSSGSNNSDNNDSSSNSSSCSSSSRTMERKAEEKAKGEGKELVVVDVREAAEFQDDGHMLFATCISLSILPQLFPLRCPRLATPVVVLDSGKEGDERALTASQVLLDLGYQNVKVLEGGMEWWRDSSREVFTGWGTAWKAFGEYVAEELLTPMMAPCDVNSLIEEEKKIEMKRSKEEQREGLESSRTSGDGDNDHVDGDSDAERTTMSTRDKKYVILDARPFEEYTNMSIPTGIFCGGGELLHRLYQVAPSPSTTVIVNCAGRTRSIVGAQTLIHAKVPHKVYACENGTMGWHLAGLEVERGATRAVGQPHYDALRAAQKHAKGVRAEWGLEECTWETVLTWTSDSSRTTFLIDVRLPEEYAEEHIQGSINAPGGQLIQALDDYIGVLGARVVLVDGGGAVRATMTAHWLKQIGTTQPYILKRGVQCLGAPLINPSSADVSRTSSPSFNKYSSQLPLFMATQGEMMARKIYQEMTPGVLKRWLEIDPKAITILDLSISTTYMRGHIPGSIWVPTSGWAQTPSPLSIDLPSTCTRVVLLDDCQGQRAGYACRYLLHKFQHLLEKEIFVVTGEWRSKIQVQLRAQRQKGDDVLGGDEEARNDIFAVQPRDVNYRPYKNAGAANKDMQAYLDWEAELCVKVKRDGCAAWA